MALIEQILFYKDSLLTADTEIKNESEKGKALKDVVGKAFETHRKRIWEYFGFTVSKEKHGALFDVDWAISYNDDLIALEEDKGHYLDSCFMERAITGFCKTINTFTNNNIKIPVLIIHSFTTYKKFNDKLNEDLDTRKETIANEITKNLKYCTLTNNDRLSAKKWFASCVNCYTDNVNEELIIKDIEFIKSLIPLPSPSPDTPLVDQSSLLPV
jgi:hypothetical protein